MTNRGILRNGIDALRTAPVGVAVLGIDATLAGLYNLADTPEVLDYITYPASVAVVALGALLIRRQFILRRRLEKNIERIGYDTRAIETTTDEWCARQTTRVVLGRQENPTYLEQYMELCDNEKATAEWAMLPHF